jgi:hypothetical protein
MGPRRPGWSTSSAGADRHDPYEFVIDDSQENCGMDGTAFDYVVRAVASGGSRRRLLGLVGALCLVGIPRGRSDAAEAAKQHGPNRAHRPGKNKDNRKGQRKGNGNGQGGFGLSDPQYCFDTLANAGCTKFSMNQPWQCARDQGGRIDLSDANLTGCDLSHSVLVFVDLTGADLEQANISNALLDGTLLTGASLTGADVTGAVFADTTCPSGVNSSAQTPHSCCGQYLTGETAPTGACPS